jgi:hypothetical protein
MSEYTYRKVRHMCQFYKRRYLGYITSDNAIKVSKEEFDANVARGKMQADKAWRSKMRGDYYTYHKTLTPAPAEQGVKNESMGNKK